MSLTCTAVHHIRTSGLTDAYLARQYRLHPHTIRRARIGRTYRDHPTPPDRAPREGAGRKAPALARAARIRRPFDSRADRA